MNRQEFLKQLESLLSDLTKEEREEAMEYYTNYFEDAGEEKEESVIAELQSPQKVADSIKDSLGVTAESTIEHPPVIDAETVEERNENFEKREKYIWSDIISKFKNSDNSVKWVVIILALVFLSPLWGGAIGVIFGLLGGLIGLVFGTAGVAIGGTFGGIGTAIAGIVQMCTGSVGGGLIAFGTGMLMTAGGLFCLILLLTVAIYLIPWLELKIKALVEYIKEKIQN